MIFIADVLNVVKNVPLALALRAQQSSRVMKKAGLVQQRRHACFVRMTTCPLASSTMDKMVEVS